MLAMKFVRLAAAAALAFPLSPSSWAAAIDGSQPFICATIQILECEQNLRCEEETVENVDVPQFLKISVQEKTAVGTRPSGEPVNAKIELIRHAEKTLFLQGVEKKLGWSMAIDEAAGHMTLMIHDQGSGFVIFGACTPH
jgi:hypothetical protein